MAQEQPLTLEEHADLGVAPIPPEHKKGRAVLVYLSYTWLGLVLFMAVFASLLPLPSYVVPIGAPRTPPGFGPLGELLGTDGLGRSNLSRVVHGAQVSLVVATGAGLLGFTVGTLIGMLAGYFRRKLDAGVSLFADVLLAFPPLILLLALAAIITPNVSTIILGLGVVGLPTFIRLSRANTMAWSTREFVKAAQNMGAGHGRILFREILPNVLPSLLAYLPIVMASMIVAEGSLGFLGLGIPPPRPSWGGMINGGKSMIADAPHVVLVPAAFIFFTVFSLNQVGDHLRGRFDKAVSK